ncbi:MAG: serine hydrolase, partial [Alistipes sp.]|nr:serine hydrolase [Candidatus Minthomonas equi]
AAGFAVKEGLFSVEDKVMDFFPEQLPEHVSDTLAAMTIRHLLTMTCGLEETPKLLSVFKKNADTDFDWISEFFASSQISMPGTQFYYNFFSSYIIAAIIEKTSGTGVVDYITPRLLEPLHITDMEWQVSPAGICVGGWGMKLCTEDMAKLGLLLLQHGKWNGRQLLPAEWVDTMTSKLVESSPTNAFTKSSDSEVLNDSENDHSQGYGYYVWQGKHGTYRMEGMLGNLVFVNPEKEVVLVFTSRSNMDQKYIDLIWKNFAHLFN